MKTILVPIDFSKQSLSSYEMALELFGSTGCKLVLAHVIESISTQVENDPKTGMRFVGEIERKLKRLLAGSEVRWAEWEIVIVSGRATERIVTICQDVEADFVVMSAHGKTGFVEGLFGNTTYAVGRKVPCSVIILK